MRWLRLGLQVQQVAQREKPVGTVFITLATRQGTQVLKECNHTDRETFKMVTTQQALNLLRQAIED